MKEENENYEDDLDTFDEIDMFLKRKYDEIVVPKSMFDTTKVFERYRKEQEEKKKRIFRVASILVIVFTVCLAVGVHIKVNMDTGKIDNIGTIDNDRNNSSENSEPNIVGNLLLKPKGIGYGKINLEIFCTIQVQDILGYEMIDGIPSTKLKAQVLKNYLKDVEGEVVEMIVPGGVFTVKELRNSEELMKNEELDKYNENDTISVNCYNSVYIPIAEVGKTYVTSLSMKDDKLQVCVNKKYGFKEYDVENNTIKEIDGSWSKIDIDEYLSDKKI